MRLQVFVSCLFLPVALSFSLTGCSDSSSSFSKMFLSTQQTPITAEPEMSVEVLSSAASFLGAASGKEQPLNIDEDSNLLIQRRGLGVGVFRSVYRRLITTT